jgi:IMP dehydrogenase
VVIEESRTFADFLLLPNLTRHGCTPDGVRLQTPLVKHALGEKAALELNIPLASAMMQSVSDDRLAIALARQGGIGFIYASQPAGEQAEMVRAVKKYKAGFVISDSNVTPTATLADVVELSARTSHSTIAVTEDGQPTGTLLGILTDKDYRLNRTGPSTPVSELMTPYSRLIFGRLGISINEANDMIWDHKIDCLPIVDEDQRLAYLVFRRDYNEHKLYGLELVDNRKRLLVGAAVNTWDYRERIPLLVEAGADVLCIDSSDGYSEWQRDTLNYVRQNYGDAVKIGAGNVVTADGFQYLAEAGADFVKIGIGGGAICITREQKGIGRGQATAVMEIASQRDEHLRQSGIYIPICSDGGISQDYHISLALAMGADFVMMGRYFARFDESPGRLVKLGLNTVKEYWGEGTSRAANWQRYHEGSGDEGGKQLLFEEGVDAYAPYVGKMADTLSITLAKTRAVMCNCGATSLREFRESARFALVSNAAFREGGAHDVMVKGMNGDG